MTPEAVDIASQAGRQRPGPGTAGAPDAAGRPPGRWVVALATFPVLYVPVAVMFVAWDGDWRTVAPVLALAMEFPLALFGAMAHAARFGERVVFRRGVFVLVVGAIARAAFILVFVWGRVQSAG